MLSIPTTIIWYVFLAGVIWSFQRFTRCFTTLNIFSLFAACLILRLGITVPFDHDVNERVGGIHLSDPILQRFYISLILMYSFLLLGAYLGRYLFGSGRIDVPTFQAQMRQERLPAGINWPLFGVIFAVALGIVLVVQLRVAVGSFEFRLIQSTAEEYKSWRGAYGDATHYSNDLLSRLAGITWAGLFPFFLFILYFLRDRGRGWKVAFGCLLGLGLFLSFLSGQKGPGVFLLAGLVIAYCLRRGRLYVREFRWSILGSLTLVSLLIVPLLYQRQYPDLNYSSAVQATFYRLTSENNRALQLYFEIYPDVYPHSYGLSSGLIRTFLGLAAPVDEIPERAIPIYYLGPSYRNTWNAAYVGVAWVDFGYAGVALESILVGLMLQWYARWFRKARKTSLVMGTQVGLMMAAIRLSEVTLTAGMLSFGFLSSFLLFLLIKERTFKTQRMTNALKVSQAHAHSANRS